MAERPHVHVLATGGTIANPPDIAGYLSGAQLIDAVPAVAELADITVEDIAARGSSEATPATWFDLVDSIEAAETEMGPDGYVVTHGSNTAEETAYFLNLTLETSTPVVVTAAQRRHATIGNDGDLNLVDSVRVAMDPAAHGRGVLLVANGEIHNSREVMKSESDRPDAWESGETGELGRVAKRGTVHFYRRSDRRGAPDTDLSTDGVDPDDFPTVEVAYSVAGSDGSLLAGAPDRGIDGLVVAALPTGRPARPKDYHGQLDVLTELAEDGLPVVISHRGWRGSPAHYFEPGPFIWGDSLRPPKARILLALGLLQMTDRVKLQALFRAY